MSRRNARKNAFYLLFQMDFNQIEEYEQVKEIFFAEQTETVLQEDKDFILEEVEGTTAHMQEIDSIIDNCARGWDVGRLSKVDLAILRLAVFEVKFSQTTPVSVAINEAVELAKKFSSDEAPAFINGILGKVASQE